MFKLLRFYSVASLLAVLATAVLIGLFYRQVAIGGLMQLAERNNLALARTVLNSVKPELIDYLDTVAQPGLLNISHSSPPPELAAAIRTLMRDSSVVRIKIYNQHGVVAFSTKTSQIGTDQRHNPGFISAINGRVADTLVYRDTFNSFDEATEEDNLMQTYIPIRASSIEPAQGVFEIYTDVNDLVHQIERTEFIIIAGVLLILTVLYAALLLVVRRARNIIESQHQTIRERTETLEILSARMLKSEESNKKKVAVELHEGLAQTLSAVKLNLENNRQKIDGDDTVGRSMAAIIPVLQSAIEDVRTIATELRPSSIDDLGLLPTINSLCRSFQQQHPGIRVRQELSLQEKDIPAPLKVILYRIVVLALDDIALHTDSDRILISLGRYGETLTLLIDDAGSEAPDLAAATLVEIDPHAESRFTKMLELTTLSGGSFAAARPSAGRIMLRAAWNA
ncbi:MAG: histidine kinase [Woeseiaceae bacterium]|nr:histidine kinase [Woeseiaceae bacterium]